MKYTDKTHVLGQGFLFVTAILIAAAATSADAKPDKKSSHHTFLETPSAHFTPGHTMKAPSKKPARHKARPTLSKAITNIMPKLASSVAPNLDGLIKPERMGLLTDLLRFFTDNTMKCLSSNRDNRLELKPFSENEAKLLSGNKTKLLSDNRPKVLNGNSVKVLSDVSFFSNINLNVNIHVENSGNKDSTVAAPDKVDSAFRRLDRDGDGKISPAEFRAGMTEK